jgi:hypothetical protein
MICHEKPLPGLPQEHRPAERRRRNYRYWHVRKPRSASGAFNNGNGMPARVALSKIAMSFFGVMTCGCGVAGHKAMQKHFTNNEWKYGDHDLQPRRSYA